MSKSRDAFRTISEVSDALDTPAHVLRFWESKFSQVKPVKRAGGRRYYRPGDMELLAGIKQLLHDDGMTIKGAQKLLREQGVKHVAALGAKALQSGTIGADDAMDETVVEMTSVDPAPISEPSEPELETKSDAAPALDVDITNVARDTSVTDAPANPGPALSLDLSSNTPDETGPADDALTEPAVTDPPIDIPGDPSDSDSKAPARLFHLLHKAAPAKLAAQAETIAPLLDRMQVLRDRIDLR